MIENGDILKMRVHEVISSGRVVVVVGWYSRNQNNFTRSLDKKYVRFYEGMPIQLPSMTGLILTTRFIGGGDRGKLKREPNVHKQILTPGDIVRLLESEGLLQLQKTVGSARQVESSKGREAGSLYLPVADADPPLPSAVLPQSPSTIIETSQEGSKKEILFSKKFLETVMFDTNGRLTKNDVGGIIRETMGEGVLASKLVKVGLLEPIVKSGDKRIGSYKAGPRLMEVAGTPSAIPTPPPVPAPRRIPPRFLLAPRKVSPAPVRKTTSATDPFEKARLIIEREPELLRRKQALEDELKQIEQDLEIVSKTKLLRAEMAELVK